MDSTTNETRYTMDPESPTRHGNNFETEASLNTNTTKHSKKQIWIKLLKAYWQDYLFLIVIGILSIVFYKLPPAATRLFPISPIPNSLNSNDNLNATVSNINQSNSYEQDLSYPIKDEIIPLWLSALTSVIFNLLVFIVYYVIRKDPQDFMAGLMGLLFSLAGSSFFQVTIKWLIGGTRPFFLEMCKPNLENLNDVVGKGQGYSRQFFDRSICTGDFALVSDALQSFPSGHSNAAFAGLFFLTLYLNGKLKLFGRRQGSYIKLILITFPTLLASIFSLTRLLDYTHHWYDIFAGFVIGTIYALLAYRMVYTSVFDFTTNHIPLPKLKDEDNRHTNVLPK